MELVYIQTLTKLQSEFPVSIDIYMLISYRVSQQCSRKIKLDGAECFWKPNPCKTYSQTSLIK